MSPEEIINKYGADTALLYSFAAPPEEIWSGVIGELKVVIVLFSGYGV